MPHFKHSNGKLDETSCNFLKSFQILHIYPTLSKKVGKMTSKQCS